jgi:hypothetical protein
MSNHTELKTPTIPSRYPLLEALLSEKALLLKGTYTYADAIQILGGSKRAIQDLIRDGKLGSRSLPGRAHFLSIDLEEFLRNSVKGPKSEGEKR